MLGFLRGKAFRKGTYDLKIEVNSLRLENDRLRAQIAAQAAVIRTANDAAATTLALWSNYNKKAA